MSDRIAEIRARLDSLSWVGDEFIAHAPADIAWLLEEVKRLQMSHTIHKEDVEEIYALRDEVNALWDVIWDLAEESDIDDISKYFLKRLNIHKENRKGSLDIGNL